MANLSCSVLSRITLSTAGPGKTGALSNAISSLLTLSKVTSNWTVIYHVQIIAGNFAFTSIKGRSFCYVISFCFIGYRSSDGCS